MQKTLDEAAQLQKTGKHAAALEMLNMQRKAGALSPQLFSVMAQSFLALKMPDGEETILKEGLRHYPDDPTLANALANYYYRADRSKDGLIVIEAVMNKKPVPLEVILTYATLCKALHRTDEAEKTFAAILQEHPNHSHALSNLAGLYFDTHHLDKAIDFWERARRAAPNDPHIMVKLAHAYFRAGQLERAWPLYAGRFDEETAARPFPQPLWNGRALGDKALLLWGEQGIGEEILYATMLPDAQARTAYIIVECDARLTPLLTRSFPDVTFIARRAIPDARLLDAAIAAQAPMGMLGALFRTRFADFPKRDTPLLKADAGAIKNIRARYEAIKKERGLNGKIIGLSWRSKPLRHGDPKSTRLQDWESLITGAPHLFINLQYGFADADHTLAQQRGWNLVSDPAIDQTISLDAFAAQISAVDEVVTVSNSAAHMAGALGIPTTLLLPQSRGLMWHWFDTRDDSPWYPSLHLLRQKKDGDWTSVLQRLTATLAG